MDKETLISIVRDMADSMTGAQSTKHWADDALWFDIPAFASKGIRPAYEMFDREFGKLKTCDVEILSMETVINGDMGIVCSVQRLSTVSQDGTVNPPITVRQTDCFEKRDGQWKLIHQHTSIPAGGDWDGKIITG